ncbi:MAG: Sec-independent protein translocase protein TatB, partial [Parvularculaceae bacterium]
IVALIVVGPKDLPGLMREAGRWAGKARRMAQDFRNAFDQMARETEMEDMRREIESLKRNNVITDAGRSIKDAVKPVETLMRAETDGIREAPNLSVAREGHPGPEPAGLDPDLVEGGRAP